MVRQIILYTRPGCHLCDAAADLLEQLARRSPLAVTEVNILSDADLFERYKHQIPVSVIAGGPTFAAPIGAAALEQVLLSQEEAGHAISLE
jgi:glutaredoxin